MSLDFYDANLILSFLSWFLLQILRMTYVTDMCTYIRTGRHSPQPQHEKDINVRIGERSDVVTKQVYLR